MALIHSDPAPRVRRPSVVPSQARIPGLVSALADQTTRRGIQCVGCVPFSCKFSNLGDANRCRFMPKLKMTCNCRAGVGRSQRPFIRSCIERNSARCFARKPNIAAVRHELQEVDNVIARCERGPSIVKPTAGKPSFGRFWRGGSMPRETKRSVTQ